MNVRREGTFLPLLPKYQVPKLMQIYKLEYVVGEGREDIPSNKHTS